MKNKIKYFICLDFLSILYLELQLNRLTYFIVRSEISCRMIYNVYIACNDDITAVSCAVCYIVDSATTNTTTMLLSLHCYIYYTSHLKKASVCVLHNIGHTLFIFAFWRAQNAVFGAFYRYQTSQIVN